MLLKTRAMRQKNQFKHCPVGNRPFTPWDRVFALVRRRPQAGFTLIEILIAMVIFSTSFLALAAGATTVMKSNHTSYNSTIATNMAQDKLEQLMAGTALPLGCTAFTVAGCSDTPTSPGNEVTFNRSWQINDLNVDTVTVKEIQIRLIWTDQTTHSVTITTAVSQ